MHTAKGSPTDSGEEEEEDEDEDESVSESEEDDYEEKDDSSEDDEDEDEEKDGDGESVSVALTCTPRMPHRDQHVLSSRRSFPSRTGAVHRRVRRRTSVLCEQPVVPRSALLALLLLASWSTRVRWPPSRRSAGVCSSRFGSRQAIGPPHSSLLPACPSRA
jgi:hypothetical protein